MLILCNGPRKAGTHLLRRCVELMGFEPMNGILRPDGYNPKTGDPYVARDVFMSYSTMRNSCIVSHVPYRDMYPYKTVTILRDPRNIVCSFMRWACSQKGTRISAALNSMRSDEERLVFIIHNMNKVGTHQELVSFTKWREDTYQLVVHFEQLMHKHLGPFVIDTIAKYLRVSGIDSEKISREMIGNTLTYNKEATNWEEYFTENVTKEFNQAGGSSLLKSWNYGR